MNIKSSGTYDNLSDESSQRFGADATGEILFNFTTTSDEQVIYLRRQSFDLFRNEKWVTDDSFYDFDFDKNVHLYGDNEVNSPSYVYSIAKSLQIRITPRILAWTGHSFLMICSVKRQS